MEKLQKTKADIYQYLTRNQQTVYLKIFYFQFEIFDEVHVLIEEISQVKNVKKTIMNILDEVMVNVDNVGAKIDILG